MRDMEVETISNQEKYTNYKTQMGRLKKAIGSQFYLEAVFIEYAIMEDRADAILRYENHTIKEKNGRPVSIDRKLRKIQDISREKKSLPNKYINTDVISEILEWKEERNGLIHALLKKSLTTEDISSVVIRGENLTKSLINMATNYRRAVERRKNK